MLAERDVKPVGAAVGADQASVAESTQSASNKAVKSLPILCLHATLTGKIGLKCNCRLYLQQCCLLVDTITICTQSHCITCCLELNHPVEMQMDDKRHEEFARAKQFKKLNKLLNTPEAKRPITQFRTFAMYVLAILVILQVVCFVVDRILMKKISR